MTLFNTAALLGRALPLLFFTIFLAFPAQAWWNRAPAIWGSPAAHARLNELYSFRPRASDPDGQRLRFSIVNKPRWMRFDSRTGRLTGQPTWTQRGRTYWNIVIRVSDGHVTRSLRPFSILVTRYAANALPVISGSPPHSAKVGKQYYFRPGAWDKDGDTLKFSVQNKPRWAGFSPRTGALYGTPPPGSAGKYWNIALRVWDGKAFRSLSPFSINVMPAWSTGTHNVTLRWTPPTRNTDGSWLTNLQGYRVFYGTASRRYTRVLDVRGASISSVEIQGLTSGTWYFAVRSVNHAGAVSSLSGEARAVL